MTKGDENLVVAVLDEGVDFSHPDLADRKWVNPGESGMDANGNDKATNGIDDDGNGFVDDVNGWNFCTNSPAVYEQTKYDTTTDPSKTLNHGTHVAGTIAGSLNDDGLVGVAPNVKIMGLTFLGANDQNQNGGECEGSGNLADQIKALEYATEKGVKISNNSYGAEGFSQAERDSIVAARDAGHLFVAAAGNSSVDNDGAGADYPASYDVENIISVAAVDNRGSLAGLQQLRSHDRGHLRPRRGHPKHRPDA